MNWLAEYFSHRTPVINLSLWAFPPPLLGPDGPVEQKPFCLPYPGIELRFVPGEEIRRGTRRYDVPARYDMREMDPDRLRQTEHVDNQAFFRSIEIFAPSLYSRDFLVRVNDSFAFVPVSSVDGTPGFFGSCIEPSPDVQSWQQMRLPWCFHGYVSI